MNISRKLPLYLWMIAFASILLPLSSCRKEGSDSGKLNGKVKRMTIYYEGFPVLQDLHFTYRTGDGWLAKVAIAGGDSLLFNYDVPGKVIMDLQPSDKRWIASLDGNTIDRIIQYDPSTEEELAAYRFVFSGTYPDSILVPDAFPLFVNVRYHDIAHDNTNYSGMLCSYLQYNAVMPALPPVAVENEVHSFTYTSLPFDARAVFQGIHDKGYVGWGPFMFTDPIYLLGLNGSISYPNNTHLIATWNGLQYEYTFNTSGDIVEIKLLFPDPDMEALIISFDYY